ncbi:hypothetical protein TWF718_002120 [Orbilia javanica]|uniref:Uncharacterized protein n=1 Tax=Orbilia javanica TaxID=47235 RepID=A0AAN8MG61_9PEZI
METDDGVILSTSHRGEYENSRVLVTPQQPYEKRPDDNPWNWDTIRIEQEFYCVVVARPESFSMGGPGKYPSLHASYCTK